MRGGEASDLLPVPFLAVEFPEMSKLQQLASDIVARAMQRGASAAECIVREGSEFSTVVRLGNVETLKEASARAAGLRVFFGKRAASTYSSDLSAEALERMIGAAVELAKITSEDPDAGLPAPEQFGKLSQDLKLYYDDVYSLPTAERIGFAKR